MPAEGSPLAKSSDLQRPLLNSPAVSNRIKSSTVVLYRYFFFFSLFLIIWKFFIKSILIAPKCSYYNCTQELGGQPIMIDIFHHG